MDVKTLKLELVQKILETTEQSVLERIKVMFDQTGDWWDLIGDDERKAIEEGLDQLNSGKSFSHDEVMKEAREKFNIR
jgi:hypothetical protein